LISLSAAYAQSTQLGNILSRSRSGQFIIQAAPGRVASSFIANLENNTNFVRLDPTLLPISCERIKQILWRELGLADAWSGKIFVKLYPAQTAEAPITIASEQFRDGWQYGVMLPDVVERSRYVRAVVQTLFLELANRDAREHSAELPAWLVEGFSEQLITSRQIEIILPPPHESNAGIKLTSMLFNARKENPLQRAHEKLCLSPPLSFQQLSWPLADEFTGGAEQVYRSSAQLFVSELLRLDDGASCLRSMLAALPRYYNWQFAFLQAFRSHFQRPIDIEKWWSLHLLHFTGRELAETWPAGESWEKLDELICSPVQVRLDPNQLPLDVRVSLQTILREWEPPRQTLALRCKVAELNSLRLRVAHEFVPLVDEYKGTIETYLQNCEHTASFFFLGKKSSLRRNTAEALQHLDALDSRRLAMRPSQKSFPAAQAAPPQP